MSILSWLALGILAFDALFFGTLGLIHSLEKRRNKNP